MTHESGRSLTGRVLLEGVLPLLLAALLVGVLTDTIVNRIDPTELRLNNLLMGTRPYRVQSDFESFVTAIGSSLILLGSAMAAALVLGITGGVAYAWSTNRPLRALAWAIATLAAALPAFFWAVAAELVLIWVFYQTGSRPLPQAGFGIDSRLVLPTFALAARPTAYVFRLTAGAVEEVRHREYVRTAIAKGLGDRLLLTRHVLPNAAPTIVGAAVLGARTALSSLAVIEFIYIWGGAGLTFVQAVGSRQPVLAAGLAISFAMASAVLNVGSDLLQRRARVIA